MSFTTKGQPQTDSCLVVSSLPTFTLLCILIMKRQPPLISILTLQQSAVHRSYQDLNNSSDSSNYSAFGHATDTPSSNVTNQNTVYQAPRKASAPNDLGTAVAAVQHGNIALELLKQSQNTKFLLNQGQGQNQPQEVTGRVGHSVNSSLSDTSFSSGSSHHSAGLQGQPMSQRSHAEQMAALNKGDLILHVLHCTVNFYVSSRT